MKNKAADEICVVCERNFRKDSKVSQPQLKVSEKAPEPLPTVVEQPAESKKESVKPVAKEEEPTKPIISKTQQKTSANGDLSKYASQVLQSKQIELLQKLENESDLGQIRNIVELIEKLHSLEEKLA